MTDDNNDEFQINPDSNDDDFFKEIDYEANANDNLDESPATSIPSADIERLRNIERLAREAAKRMGMYVADSVVIIYSCTALDDSATYSKHTTSGNQYAALNLVQKYLDEMK